MQENGKLVIVVCRTEYNHKREDERNRSVKLSLCVCVCVCVLATPVRPEKTNEPVDRFRMTAELREPKEQCIRRGTYGRYRANIIERSQTTAIQAVGTITVQQFTKTDRYLPVVLCNRLSNVRSTGFYCD